MNPARGQLRLICALAAVVATVAMASPAHAAPPTCTNATVTCVTGTAADGSTFKVEVPAEWNGTLLLYSHGYVPPFVPNPPAETAGNRAVADHLLAEGYALAGSSYASNGWAVESALRDQIDLLDRFEQRFGKPHRTIAWGHSMGGMITAGLVQRHPRRFGGALPFCGILGGSVGLWNQNLDLQYAIKTLLAADPDPAVSVPASQLELVHITNWQANVALANAAVTAAQQTPRGRARLALAGALFNLPDWYEEGTRRPAREDYAQRQENQFRALQFQLAFIFGFRSDLEQRAGGNPSWNVGVDYKRMLTRSGGRDLAHALYRQAALDLRADLRLLERAPRVRSDPAAARYLIRNVVFDGRIRAPVLTVHTTADGLVVSPHEAAYRDAVRRAGRARLLEQLYVDRPGHCSFTEDETLTALDVLLARLDRGRWPADPGSAFAAYEPPPFLRPFDLASASRSAAGLLPARADRALVARRRATRVGRRASAGRSR
jgi:pimeloyl-ACP methyl ester carboxylesterase